MTFFLLKKNTVITQTTFWFSLIIFCLTLFFLFPQKTLAFDSACAYLHQSTNEYRCIAIPREGDNQNDAAYETQAWFREANCARFCRDFPDRAAECTFSDGGNVCMDGWRNTANNDIENRAYRKLITKTRPGPPAPPAPIVITKADCQKIVAEQIHPNCIVGVAGGFLNDELREKCVQFEIQKCYDQCTDCSTDPTNPTRNKPENYDGPIPDCAFSYEGCRDINDVLQLVVNIGEFIFKIIGTLAFVFFIYGGITMIASFGSADKFQKGKDILTAAVIGLVITFSAYLLIQFVLQTLGVSADLQSIR